jgi:eukaryotic-like serine/threonine-protein kinase
LFLDTPEFQSTPISNFPPPVAPTSKATTQQVSLNFSVLTNNGISVNSRSRRIFLKWLGFAGVGMAGVIALSRLVKNSSAPEKSPSSPRFGATPQLTKIQFASVKLNSYGKIVDQPTGQAEIFAEDLGEGASLTMVKIPAGKFMMGSLVSEKERNNRENLQHQVAVAGFYLSQTLVTQRQWQVVMGNNPSHFKGDDKLPVDSVNWLDATDFCQKLSQSTGHTYRLPSETEWEYACRAGTTTPFAFGETIIPEVVNYNGNYVYGNGVKGDYRQKTNVVGRFPANAFGLYDMHGNLWEWCLDEYIDSYKNGLIDGSTKKDIKYRDSSKLHVLRGGSWYGDPGSCRSAFRDRCVIVDHHNFFGFRVVYSPTKT